jgi:hypothetical protein
VKRQFNITANYRIFLITDTCKVAIFKTIKQIIKRKIATLQVLSYYLSQLKIPIINIMLSTAAQIKKLGLACFMFLKNLRHPLAKPKVYDQLGEIVTDKKVIKEYENLTRPHRKVNIINAETLVTQ